MADEIESDKPDPLNAKEKRFVLEYLKDLNQTQAAMRAGYTKNLDSAANIASRLVRKVQVSAAIKLGMDERAKMVQVDSHFVISELKKIANVDLSQAYDDTGKLKAVDQMPEDVRRAIAGIETVEEFEGFGQERTWTGYTQKVKFWPKDKALELLARHLGMFKEKIEHSGPDGGPIEFNVQGLTDDQLAAKIAEHDKRRGK
jgi:phage terminase small subunit